jgi:hypothetical protein
LQHGVFGIKKSYLSQDRAFKGLTESIDYGAGWNFYFGRLLRIFSIMSVSVWKTILRVKGMGNCWLENESLQNGIVGKDRDIVVNKGGETRIKEGYLVGSSLCYHPKSEPTINVASRYATIIKGQGRIKDRSFIWI